MTNKEELKQNKKEKSGKVFSTVAASFLVLAHIAIICFVLLSYRYYAIYPEVFGSALAVVVCLLIIVDIIFFIGFNHKDLVLKIISLLLSLCIFLGGTVGVYAVAKVNGMLDGILGNGAEKQVETFSGVFVSYEQEFTSLSDLNKKKVGLMQESTNGLSYIAQGLLNENKVDYIDKHYASNAELVQALIDKEVDAIVITSAYRSIFQNDENSNVKDYLDKFNDFYTFSKDLEIQTTKTKKDLTKEPFNVLLIGYSRTELGSSIGLADAIIVATINPKTYTVSMMSIARDSFVPIACYGGSYDKINSGRSTSRACFIETVEDFIGMDIDYYMEADYLAIVYMVNALGGVYIDNPVDFELDGTFVPAGQYIADGWQALEFCRERHHMPNGDFDRQKHQKEVIIEIAKKLIESGDVSRGLTIMNGISKWFSTDFTLQELSGVFNLLLNTKNNTDLDTFDLVDFQTLRITGSGGIKYYSYSMHLPLWVYLIYQGSYDESIGHINEVMGKYDEFKQDSSFKFSARAPYVRKPFYSETYENRFMFEPDPMPAYWPSLTDYTIGEALTWASENGVKLKIESIMPGSSEYNPQYEGCIMEQSVKYGSLVSECNEGTITVMGTGELDESKQVPSFVGSDYRRVIKWAEKYGVKYAIEYDSDVDGDLGEVTYQNYSAYTLIEDIDEFKVVVKYGTYNIAFESKYGDSLPNIEVRVGAEDLYFEELSDCNVEGKSYSFLGWFTEKDGGYEVYSTSDVVGEKGKTITLYARWKETYKISLDANGGYCDYSSITTAQSLPRATKKHYNFDGWYTQAEGGDKVSDASSLTANTTLYAHYSAADWTEESSDLSQCSCESQEGKSLVGCTLSGYGDETTGCNCNYTDISEE